MRILHISDTHGSFNQLIGPFDVILHTGDLLPNFPAIMSGDKNKEIECQANWISQNISHFKKWIGDNTFLFVAGNHDFTPSQRIVDILVDNNIKAVNITEKFHQINDKKFYGIPNINKMVGRWAYESTPEEMLKAFNKYKSVLSMYRRIDVVAAHMPLYGMLDFTRRFERMGSTVFLEEFNKLDYTNLPSVYAHGHCHECFGVAVHRGMIVSNAATTQNVIEIPE
jgi:Icc-related predicted phosphoesterase